MEILKKNLGRFAILVVALVLGLAAEVDMWGQASEGRLSVLSFEPRPTDMDAKVNYPLEDWNGNTCAIIKVYTTKQGFSFDTGTISITKTIQKKGEVWVYVSPGVRKFKISHADYKPCDYEFPSSIQAASVYVLDLQAQEAVAPSGPTSMVTAGFLKLKTNPKECTVRVGKTQDYEIETKRITEGNYTKRLDFGRYYYKIEAPFYETDYGQIDLQKTTGAVDINLLPAYNFLKINSTPESGATVIVKNSVTGHEVSGTTPFAPADKFAKGEYIITLFHSDYATVEKRITLTGDGTSKEFSYPMNPQYATVTCRCSDSAAQIWIDDEFKGTGSWTGRVSGAYSHKLEARKDNHAIQTKGFTVTNGETKTITVDAPTPKMGGLEITSVPDFATVKVDGRPFGETPMINEIIMGSHKVEVSAAGYQTKTYDVVIPEGRSYAMEAKLEKAPAYSSMETASSSGTAVSLNNVKTFTVNGVSFNMVFVEGGTFTMGVSTKQDVYAEDDEGPVHSVILSPFSIGRTEVTQELWTAVMGRNPSHFEGDRNPVENITYKDCLKFIEKLNKAVGQDFRLPTEAEWEYAARGGKHGRGYRYSGSDIADEVAYHEGNSGNRTQPVASRQANELGLYDMSGNVREWCLDWYGNYSSSEQTDPKGPDVGSFRVTRGGCWEFSSSFCRNTARMICSPTSKHRYLGLRLALSE